MDEFLKSVVCSGTECFSWVLVFLNILAVFYLVFCSFWRVTRIVKTIGWVWLAGLLVATMGILIVHTCIYTLLVTVFTAMMLVAILAVICSKPKAEVAEQPKVGEARERIGSYLVSETDDGRYVFAIYDAERKFIVGSKYSYATLEKAKSEICVCRDNGMIANIDDRTGEWVKFVDYPKFEIYRTSGKYYFRLAVGNKYILLQSGAYNGESECMAMLEKAKRSAVSFDVYFSSGKEKGKNFERYKETATVREEREADPAPVVTQTSPAAKRVEAPKTVVSSERYLPCAPVRPVLSVPPAPVKPVVRVQAAPAEFVASAPVVSPAKAEKTAPCPMKACREKIDCGNDVFLRSLTSAELFEFVAVFIKKRYGAIRVLPEYVIGGKNDEFFFKFFLHLGSCRPRASEKLMEKIYQHVARGCVRWNKARLQ